MSVLSIQPTFQFSYFRFLIHIPHYFSTKIRISACFSEYYSYFCSAKSIVVINTEERPDRCSIRNWAFFMSIGIIFVTSRKW